MKISIAWLFDHINAHQNEIDITTLVTRFNHITAEIEGYEKVELPLNNLSCAQVIGCDTQSITVNSPEWNSKYTLPYRANINLGDWLLIYKNDLNLSPSINNLSSSINNLSSPVNNLTSPNNNLSSSINNLSSPVNNLSSPINNTGNESIINTYRWATTIDLGGTKEGLVPPLYLEDESYTGEWKTTIEKTDYILHVDNKSLTHRPDMWGHRGFAREIAAIFNLPLKPLDPFLVDTPYHEKKSQGATGTIHVSIEDATCDRFAGLEISAIERKPSLLWMAVRLARIDSKPIDAIIDTTNYVMFDIGQPMHAFDANKLPTKKIIIRKAHNKEPLTLRDGTSIELTSADTIVCDSTTPIGLAGITGDGSTAIHKHTHAIFIIAEHFDPTSIRLSSTYHKIRTESSTRFEKNIDPEQTIHALKRFLKLYNNASIQYQASESILSLGLTVPNNEITIEHAFIEKRLGVSIDTSFIIHTLEALSCKTTYETTNGHTIYTVTIPTFRATKDIRIREDIIEEIGRFYGYDNIPLQLPPLQHTAKDISSLMRIRAIKRLLSDACAMRELYTYSFYDESFLRQLSWEPQNSLSIQNPVSENWQRLVTSLIPNLIKAVAADAAEHDTLNFFELARIWNPTDNTNTTSFTKGNPDTHEKEMLTGIIFNKKQEINFYEAKLIIQKISDLISMPTTWVPIEQPEAPWFTPYKTAYIMHNDICLGIAGILSESFLHTVTEGHAFAFELNAALLRSYKQPPSHYKPVPKYPTVERDISMFVPLTTTVDEIIHLISVSNSHISTVTLIDFFEKKEWLDHRSLTVRCTLINEKKTMTKEEVDTIYQTIVDQLVHQGAEIR